MGSNATDLLGAVQADDLLSGRSRSGHGPGLWARLHDNVLNLRVPADEAARRRLVLLVLLVRIAYAALHVFYSTVPSRRKAVAACLGST